MLSSYPGEGIDVVVNGESPSVGTREISGVEIRCERIKRAQDDTVADCSGLGDPLPGEAEREGVDQVRFEYRSVESADAFAVVQYFGPLLAGKLRQSLLEVLCKIGQRASD